MVTLVNKIICLDNKKTSIRLDVTEWEALDIICDKEKIKRNHLLELINDSKDEKMGLTYSVRLFSLIYLHHWFLNKEYPDYKGQNDRLNVAPIFDAIKGIM